MLMLLDRRRSIRCLYFPLVKPVLELNFSERHTACWSAMQVHLTYYVVRDRFDTIPKREAIPRISNLLCGLSRVVNSVFTKSW